MLRFPNRDNDALHAALKQRMSDLSTPLLRSIPGDQGIAMAHHTAIAATLGASIRRASSLSGAPSVATLTGTRHVATASFSNVADNGIKFRAQPITGQADRWTRPPKGLTCISAQRPASRFLLTVSLSRSGGRQTALIGARIGDSAAVGCCRDTHPCAPLYGAVCGGGLARSQLRRCSVEGCQLSVEDGK